MKINKDRSKKGREEQMNKYKNIASIIYLNPSISMRMSYVNGLNI